MHSSDAIYWIIPKWKLMWTMAGVIIILSILILGMIPWMNHLYQAAITEGRIDPGSGHNIMLQIYILLGYFSFLGMMGGLLFFSLARYSIGVSSSRIFIKTASSEPCGEEASSIIWSKNTLHICGVFVPGIFVQRSNGFTIYPEEFLKQYLFPKLEEYNRISGFRMHLWALQKGNIHAWVINIIILSLLVVSIWLYVIS